MRTGLNAAEKPLWNTAAIYDQLLDSIPATLPSFAAKIHSSISLTLAVSSLSITYTTPATLAARVFPSPKMTVRAVRQELSTSHICYGCINSSPFHRAATMQPKATRNRKGRVKGDCWGNTLLKLHFQPQRLQFNSHFRHKWGTGFIPNLIYCSLRLQHKYFSRAYSFESKPWFLGREEMTVQVLEVLGFFTLVSRSI